MRNLINIVKESSIDDAWFNSGSFETFKKANPVSYEIAQDPGTIDTLEGPVNYKAGFYIITGPSGEKYPITPQRFNDLYNDNKNGTATPKKIIKLAKLADHDGIVKTSWGEPLNYTTGNDFIVKHGSGDYGAIKKDIFYQTYDTANIKGS
jgi:hypothetical protein